MYFVTASNDASLLDTLPLYSKCTLIPMFSASAFFFKMITIIIKNIKYYDINF
jgi:hypothetical protein